MPPDDFSRFFHEAPCGFLSVDDDGRIVRINDTLRTRLGFERAELAGVDVQTLLSLSSRIFYQTHVFPLLRLQGRVDEVYLTLRARDGSTHPMFVNGVRRADAGAEPVTDCVLFPLDERRKYEAELLAAKRAAEDALAANVSLSATLQDALDDLRGAQHRLVEEQKMAGLGRMAAAVGHEIKNPLHFIINFGMLSADLAEDLRRHLAVPPDGPGDELATALVDDLARNARRVVQHARRADTVVRGMMDHARGAVSDGPSRVEVNAVVRDAVARALEARGGSPTVDVELVCASDAGHVAGAQPELVRALESLIANALDAVDAQGGGAETPGVVRVETRRAGGRVLITVTDTGHGIAAADLGRIFEPFFTTRPPGSGRVGLGLSLAYGRVQAHGGTLTADSDGSGAAFTLSLPTADP